MARNTTKTYILIDANGKPAAGELQRLEDAAKDVDKATDEAADPGKWDSMKAGVAGVGDLLGKAAGPLGAGALVAGIGKAVTEVADLTIEAGTMATALDLTVEEASRLNAAFSDVGLEMNDTVDIALQIGQAVEDDALLAEALGIAVGEAVTPVQALEAGINNWDFLSASQRAKAFGEEGVRSISRLVSEGKTFQEILDEVADNRIFDDENLDQAQEFKEATRDIETAFQGIVIELSEGVIPALADAAGLAAEIVNLLDKDLPGGGFSLTDSTVDIFSKAAFHAQVLGDALLGIDFEPAVDGAEDLEEQLGKDTRGAYTMADALKDAGWKAEEAFDAAQSGAEDALTAWDKYSDTLDASTTYQKLKLKIRDLGSAQFEENKKSLDGWSKNQIAINETYDAVGEYLTEVLKIPDDKATAIVLGFAGKTPAQIEEEIDQATRDRQAILDFRVRVQQDPSGFNPFGGGFVDGRSAPSSTTNNTTVNVTMPRTANPRELTATLDTWKRANG